MMFFNQLTIWISLTMLDIAVMSAKRQQSDTLVVVYTLQFTFVMFRVSCRVLFMFFEKKTIKAICLVLSLSKYIN